VKEEYNKLIENIKKAERFMEKNQDHDNILDFLDKFIEALDKSNELIASIEKELGRDMTSKEILEGF